MRIITAALLLIKTLCGFHAPESILRHGQYIFVSNVNGSPLVKDGNGYISKLDYKGKLIKRKFITGLNAPKGLAANRTSLFVTDIDVVYEFNIYTGNKKNVYKIKGSKFLNDITVKREGTLFVTDMFAHKIFIIRNGKVKVFTDKIKYPNGITLGADDGLYVVQFKGGGLYYISEQGRIKKIASGIHSGDGIGLRPNTNYAYVSSHQKGLIYKINLLSGRKRVIYKGLKTPADISVDNRYKRILIPLMKKNCITSRELR